MISLAFLLRPFFLFFHSPSCYFPQWFLQVNHQLITHPLLLLPLLFTLIFSSSSAVWSPRLHSEGLQMCLQFESLWDARKTQRKTALIALSGFLFLSKPDIYWQTKLECFSCASWLLLVSTFLVLLSCGESEDMFAWMPAPVIHTYRLVSLLFSSLPEAVAQAQHQLLPGSCTFESSTCGYTSDGESTSWRLHKDGTGRLLFLLCF